MGKIFDFQIMKVKPREHYRAKAKIKTHLWYLGGINYTLYKQVCEIREYCRVNCEGWVAFSRGEIYFQKVEDYAMVHLRYTKAAVAK